MHTMHPTLLVGPADWDAERRPKQEFDDRLAAFWRACDPAFAGIIVYGSPASHAELAYLTHFTPKLEAAIALLSRRGEPRLLVGGGANMLAAAKPLTFIETLLPLRDAGAIVPRWASELWPDNVAWVNGDAMPFGQRLGVGAALLTPRPDITSVLAAVMRRKGARELALIREACASLEAAFQAVRLAQHKGGSMTEVVLAGEAAAYARGAQDVRSLFGDDGKLAPFTEAVTAAMSPLQVYLAVRHDGYWAEGFAVTANEGRPLGQAAMAILGAAIDRVGPGVAHRAVAELIVDAVGPSRVHPVTQGSFGHSIGLAVQEPGHLNRDSDAIFAAGEVYTMRVGLNEAGSHELVSAMVVVTDGGHEVLWRGADA